MKEDEIREAIKKVALGFSVSEVTEEFSVDEGELKLVKRKETKKDVPPDLKAAKLLLEGDDYSALSDEELLKEKERLLAFLNEESKKQTDNK